MASAEDYTSRMHTMLPPPAVLPTLLGIQAEIRRLRGLLTVDMSPAEAHGFEAALAIVERRTCLLLAADTRRRRGH
ncbi:MAG TPA: hypothetical protein VJ276_17400 [Thermoanaerobaculia bacterium]|nr:hypothetical protein [Thermoanaerobaculia bacterium]